MNSLLETFFVAVTKPFALMKKIVTGMFFWSTRIFGMKVAMFQTLTGKGE